jgi:hydroxymethylpyrimidine pyrophosphatase-like HAD family hydrolase
MLLALDYDETYTRDPIFWDAVIKLAIQRGHSVICATMRHEHEGAEVIRDLGDQVEAIVFTGRKAKHGAVHAAGFMPSVWIDDSPNWIHQDAR